MARGITYLQFSKCDYAEHASSFPSLSGLLPPFLHYLLLPFLRLFPPILLPYPPLFSLPSSFLSILSSSLHLPPPLFPLLSLSRSLWWCQPQPHLIPYPYSSSGACIEVHSVMWDRSPAWTASSGCLLYPSQSVALNGRPLLRKGGTKKERIT